MGVRPPQDDTNDEPEAVTFGIAALDAQLDRSGVTFPASSEELVRALGDPAVPYNAGGNSVRLSEALDELHFQQFETEQELLNALHPVFEAYRERRGGGFVGRLRSLLPF
ncbi:hypothetical protein [Halorarius litoreus]|uniref:DUF5789 family protein n=1 Tax=Halorarius litoreus TaxID=2962676 RepID=UPI0020CC71A8|nr:hypothetical protein [Halorarius litoreus]